MSLFYNCKKEIENLRALVNDLKDFLYRKNERDIATVEKDQFWKKNESTKCYNCGCLIQHGDTKKVTDFTGVYNTVKSYCRRCAPPYDEIKYSDSYLVQYLKHVTIRVDPKTGKELKS